MKPRTFNKRGKHMKKGKAGKLALYGALALVIFLLGVGVGMTPVETTSSPAPTVTETVTPRPTETVTAKPKPAPTVTVTKEVEVTPGACTQALGTAEELFAAARRQFALIEQALSGQDVTAESNANEQRIKILNDRYHSFAETCKGQ